MAGSNPAFNAAAFRTAIRNTMIMGSPNNPAERATFRWKVERDYVVDDPARKPYDWTSSPVVENVHPDVQIPVAVEFSARPAGSSETQMAEFDTSRAVLTILDEDFVKIEGADEVLLGGNSYSIQFVGPPLGMFEVTVYQMYCEAMDES